MTWVIDWLKNNVNLHLREANRDGMSSMECKTFGTHCRSTRSEIVGRRQRHVMVGKSAGRAIVFTPNGGAMASLRVGASPDR